METTIQNQKQQEKQPNVKCDKNIQNQCVLQVNSYGCKLRYFNKQCMMALKEQHIISK